MKTPACPVCGRRFGKGEIQRGVIRCPGCRARLKIDDAYTRPLAFACAGLVAAVCYALGVRGLALLLVPLATVVPLDFGISFAAILFAGLRLVVDREESALTITPRDRS